MTADALVIFEVLPGSNRKADREWRRKVYASVSNCRHYVTVSLKRAEVHVFDRATGWLERRIQGLDGMCQLDALGLSLPPADIYRYSSLGGGTAA